MKFLNNRHSQNFSPSSLSFPPRSYLQDEVVPYCTQRELKFYWGKGGKGGHGGYGGGHAPPRPPAYKANHPIQNTTDYANGDGDAITVDCLEHPNHPLCNPGSYGGDGN